MIGVSGSNNLNNNGIFSNSKPIEQRDYFKLFSLISNHFKLFDTQTFGEKLTISLRVKDPQSGKTKKYNIWIKDFRPYFFVPHKHVEEKLEYFIPFLRLHQDVYKIELNHPKEVLNIRSQFKYTYEADILYDLRFHYDILRDFKEDLSITPRIWFFDIEVFGNYEKAIPKPNEDKKFINAIAIYDNYLDKYISIVVIPRKKKNISNTSLRTTGILNIESENRIIIKVSNEEELIKVFLQLLNKLQPDILTGWNSMTFDYPFIVERIKYKYKKLEKYLSPFQVNVRKSFNQTLNITEYEIVGLVHLDYMLLYKKYGDKLNRYTLENVAQNVLKTGKVQYEGSLDQLYEFNFEKFIEYNKVDIQLIKEIDERTKFIQLVEILKNLSTLKLYTFNFDNTTKFGDGIILKYIRKELDEPLVMRTHPKHHNLFEDENLGKYKGAVVRKPKIGFYEWIIDFDASSMYPSIIRTLNISPDVFYLQILEDVNYLKKYIRPYLLDFDLEDLEKISDLLTIPIDPNYEPNFNLRDEKQLKWFNEKYKKEIVKEIWETINSEDFQNRKVNVYIKERFETWTLRELKQHLQELTNSKGKIRNFRISTNGAVFISLKKGVLKLIEDQLTDLRSKYKNKRKVAGKLINEYS